jgi:hypothetical protein
MYLITNVWLIPVGLYLSNIESVLVTQQRGLSLYRSAKVIDMFCVYFSWINIVVVIAVVVAVFVILACVNIVVGFTELMINLLKSPPVACKVSLETFQKIKLNCTLLCLN